MATNNDSLIKKIAAMEQGLSILESALLNDGYKKESLHIIAGCILVANLCLKEKYPLNNTLDIQSIIDYLQRAHTILQQTYLQQIKPVHLQFRMFALKGALEQRNIPVHPLRRVPIPAALHSSSDYSFCSHSPDSSVTENMTSATVTQKLIAKLNLYLQFNGAHKELSTKLSLWLHQKLNDPSEESSAHITFSPEETCILENKNNFVYCIALEIISFYPDFKRDLARIDLILKK